MYNKFFIEKMKPQPGDLITTSHETKLWSRPYSVNSCGLKICEIHSGNYGIVIATLASERFVLFQGRFGWTSVHSLNQV